MLEIRHLTKRFGAVAAIDDVSMRVGAGDIVGLLGLNGAGKTTLLRMASGTLAPTGGDVFIEGRDLFDGSPESRAPVGYLPEGRPLPGDATVGEYLRFRSSLYGLSGKRADARARDLARKCGISELEGIAIERLSAGQKARCALAGSVPPAAKVLLLDEPFAGLDPAQAGAIAELIRAVSRKAAVVVSTHLLANAAKLCTRFAVLDSGRLAAERDYAGDDLADWFMAASGSTGSEAKDGAAEDAAPEASAVAATADDAGGAAESGKEAAQ